MNAGQAVQGVWLGVWLVVMPVATALIGRARVWVFVAVGWAMLHAVVGVATR